MLLVAFVSITLNQRANQTHLHAAQPQCKLRTRVWLCQTLPELNSSTKNSGEISWFVQRVSETVWDDLQLHEKIHKNRDCC